MSETEQEADERKSFGPFEDFEACVLEFEDDTEVDDPEALCADMEQNPDDYFSDDSAKTALLDLEVPVVSGVATPAQDSSFVLFKSADSDAPSSPSEAAWARESELLLRKDDESDVDGEGEDDAHEQKTWAAVLIPGEADKQEDVISKAEIERAAHTFLKEHRQVDVDHDLLTGQADPIESWTLKEEQTFQSPTGETSREYPTGTWMLGLEWADEPWQRILDGELTGLSIYGQAAEIDIPGEGSEAPAKETADERAAAKRASEAEARRCLASAADTLHTQFKSIPMTDEDEESGKESGEDEVSLSDIHDLTQKTNDIATNVQDTQEDLVSKQEDLAERMDSAEAEISTLHEQVDKDSEGEDDDESGGAESGASGTKGGEDDDEKEHTEVDVDEVAEEAAEKGAEKGATSAVKSILGLDDDDLETDEDGNQVVRKSVFDPEFEQDEQKSRMTTDDISLAPGGDGE